MEQESKSNLHSVAKLSDIKTKSRASIKNCQVSKAGIENSFASTANSFHYFFDESINHLVYKMSDSSGKIPITTFQSPG